MTQQALSTTRNRKQKKKRKNKKRLASVVEAERTQLIGAAKVLASFPLYQ